MKFRKTAMIDAEQWFPGMDISGVFEWNDARCSALCVAPGTHVHTLEGPLNVSPGDWIITGVNGEKYPCKPDIFSKTYEPVAADARKVKP